jgi:hypothetical protein
MRTIRPTTRNNTGSGSTVSNRTITNTNRTGFNIAKQQRFQRVCRIDEGAEGVTVGQV